MGLTLDETLDMPLGQLKTLIAIQQIKMEGAVEKFALSDDDIIPDLR